jgi:hypothetical protein
LFYLELLVPNGPELSNHFSLTFAVVAGLIPVVARQPRRRGNRPFKPLISFFFSHCDFALRWY